LFVTATDAQDTRIFRNTPETIAIWEFNDLPGAPGDAIPDGTVIPDLSGNGRDAVAKNNASAQINIAGNPQRDDACGPGDLGARRVGGAGAAHVATRDDTASAFEFSEDQSFSFELLVVRDENVGTQNWGILAGTWHSRTLLDDGGSPNEQGAWYGYGFIRHNEQNGWRLNLSPINPDRTFTPSFNEAVSEPFDIPAGEHYVATSVNRETGIATVYLNGTEVASVSVPPGRAFYTPTDYEPANFAFLTGVDDVTRGAYRTAPTGYAISAARVQSRALTFEEVEENVFLLEDCIPIPFGDASINAILSASNLEPLVGECVGLSGASSEPSEGETITTYEWRIGEGGFEEGAAEREISFDAPTSVEVTLRVTDSAGNQASRSTTIVAGHPAPTASIAVSLDGAPAGGDRIWVREGTPIQFDGSGSVTPIPGTALACPRADGVVLDAPAITEFSWDVDGDGSEDATGASVELPNPSGPDDFTVTLTVTNAAGESSETSVDISVVPVPNINPTPAGRIFLETDETIGIWEFNDLPGEPGDNLDDGTIVEDLAGAGLDAIVEGNFAEEGLDASVQVGAGDSGFGETNLAARKQVQAPGRLAVDDAESFEFGPTDNFSVELYVTRDDITGGENWGVLAGTWHSRTLLDDGADPIANGAWYGFGFVRNAEGGGWLFNMSPINEDRTFAPSFNEVKTDPPADIPAGSHYVVATVDRQSEPPMARMYINGVRVGEVDMTPQAGLAFYTPDGYDPARMMFLSGEDDASRGSYRNAPTGYGIDAARVQMKALSAEEVSDNHLLIRAGFAAGGPTIVPEDCGNGIDDDGDGLIDCDDDDCAEVGPPDCPPPADTFVRGDSNSSGTIDLTDGIRTLNFLFTGGPEPTCLDAADSSDDGQLGINDAIQVFSYLFTGGPPPQDPAPSSANYPPSDCGSDATNDELDCAEQSPTCSDV